MSLATRKAEAYVSDRFPTLARLGGDVCEVVMEDYRAGFVQGLEAALEAIVHADSDGLASAEIRRMLGEEA